MKTYDYSITAPVAQGDVMIKRIDSLPEGLEESKAEDGNYVVAHSETGHHHVMSSADCTVWDQDEFRSYVQVDNVVHLRHLRSFDTHETIALPPGKYRITRQREYVADGYRRAQD